MFLRALGARERRSAIASARTRLHARVGIAREALCVIARRSGAAGARSAVDKVSRSPAIGRTQTRARDTSEWNRR